MAKQYNPGQVAPVSALYEVIGPRGGHTGKEVTVAKGKELPPTPKPGMAYEISERAHNASGHNRKR
jgi:3,4-dihydroxy-2-butanone 4-phosphate synthase